MDLHSVPAFCADAVLRECVSEWYTSYLVSPTDHRDTDNNHVKRDRDDGRDLVVSSNVSAALSSSRSDISLLTMSRTTY